MTLTLAVDNTPNDRTVVIVGEYDNEEVHQRHSRLLNDHVAVTRQQSVQLLREQRQLAAAKTPLFSRHEEHTYLDIMTPTCVNMHD